MKLFGPNTKEESCKGLRDFQNDRIVEIKL